LQRILAREPDHAEARRRLGFVRQGEAWVREAELARQRREAERAQHAEERARRREQLELETATLRRERAEVELREARAQLAEERAARAAPPRPSWYSPVVIAPGIGYGGWNQRGPVPLHNWSLPAPTNNANYPINGVRSPASYIDEAQRAVYGPNVPPR
jgi:hypothetical protein